MYKPKLTTQFSFHCRLIRALLPFTSFSFSRYANHVRCCTVELFQGYTLLSDIVFGVKLFVSRAIHSRVFFNFKVYLSRENKYFYLK